MRMRPTNAGNPFLRTIDATFRTIGLCLITIMAPAALAQNTEFGESAKAIIGSWEFSTADRERKCTLSFYDARGANGFKLQFEDKCAELFPFTKDITAWTFPDNDLLNLRDATGKSIVEFSEVEAGIYEAPTTGQGVLFLQNAAAAGPPPPPPEKFAGDWAIVRNGKVLCGLTFSIAAVEEGFSLAAKPDCDQAIVRLGFASWRIDRDELMLKTARGNPWRFEEGENGIWRRVPETANPYTLVRQ
jgi:hypothetical protein